jgi:arylsulfatase A-like enzyme
MRTFTKAYYAMISRLDHQVGTLVARLKQRGLYENTVIIFLSDNGYFPGNHGLGNKITMHEESVRVPMFVHWPQAPTQGVRSDALVSSLDVYPTIVELAGLDPAGPVSGQSLVPLLSRPGARFRTYVASEGVGVGGGHGEGHRMVRTDEWKYMLSGTNEEELYHLGWDPYEQTNLVRKASAEEQLRYMRTLMKEWMDKVGDAHADPPNAE